MNLYDYFNLTDRGFDTCDDDCKEFITIYHTEKEGDNYHLFRNELMKKVEILGRNDNGELIVNWSACIKGNMEKCRKFTKEHWVYQYEEKDEFISAWIKELNNYLAGKSFSYRSGTLNEEFYGTLIEFLETIDSVESKNYIVCIKDSYLRDTQVFNPENTAALSYMNCDAVGAWFDEEMENDDNWHDYIGHAFLGIYKWNEVTKENLREYVAKKYGLLPEILDVIPVD